MIVCAIPCPIANLRAAYSTTLPYNALRSRGSAAVALPTQRPTIGCGDDEAPPALPGASAGAFEAYWASARVQPSRQNRKPRTDLAEIYFEDSAVESELSADALANMGMRQCQEWAAGDLEKLKYIAAVKSYKPSWALRSAVAWRRKVPA